MQITIQRVIRTIPINIEEWNTVLEIKHQIQEKERIPVAQQILIYNGKQLENEQAICKYCISEFANIYLVVHTADII